MCPSKQELLLKKPFTLYCSINNIVIVSGGQRRDSAIHIHASILPQAPPLSSLPHNTEQKEVLLIHVGPFEKSTSPRKIVTAWTQMKLISVLEDSRSTPSRNLFAESINLLAVSLMSSHISLLRLMPNIFSYSLLQADTFYYLPRIF